MGIYMTGVRWALYAFTIGLMTDVHAVDYRQLSCKGQLHTMCLYPPGGGFGCRDFQGGLTNREKSMIVTLHNELRQKVALGKEYRGHQPASGDMMQMFYDEELAKSAQRWADQCDVKEHDLCRRIPGFDHVGQNIGWISGWDTSGAVRPRLGALRDIVVAWYDEVGNTTIDVRNFDPRPRDAPLMGHYTQMVWAHTYLVGCGFVQFLTKTVYEYRLVCNYAPGGNYRKTEIYEIGLPCSKCPKNTTCSKMWHGLCVFDHLNHLPRTVPVAKPHRAQEENNHESEEEDNDDDDDDDDGDGGYKYFTNNYIQSRGVRAPDFASYYKNKDSHEEDPFADYSRYENSSGRHSCGVVVIMTLYFVLLNVL